MNKPYHFDFSKPETVEELSNYIGLDAGILCKLIDSDNRGGFYTRHCIQKRSRHRKGRTRIVWTAKYTIYEQAHKAIARRFNIFARHAVPDFPHPSAYGYVKHKSTKDNAKIHCGAPLLLRADIENFFPSISYKRLVSKFQELGMKEAPAIALAKFVTIDDRLPLGLNSSPMLANLICFDLDNQFEKLASDYGCKYTRYADDISISGLSRLPERREIEKILNKEGFNLSQKNFELPKKGKHITLQA